MSKFKFAVIEKGQDCWWVWFDSTTNDLNSTRHSNRSKLNTHDDAVIEAKKFIHQKRGKIFERTNKKELVEVPR